MDWPEPDNEPKSAAHDTVNAKWPVLLPVVVYSFAGTLTAMHRPLEELWWTGAYACFTNLRDVPIGLAMLVPFWWLWWKAARTRNPGLIAGGFALGVVYVLLSYTVASGAAV